MVDAACILGDWGTSSLRLWAVDAAGRVLVGRRSGQGMGGLAPGAFEPVLREHLAALGAGGVPVLLCGMVGARQGWREAPYVALPADLGAICDAAMPVGMADMDVRILPGVSSAEPADVMRGEETQLLGVLAGAPGLAGVVVLPGTHCKWVWLAEGRISRFETAMTGELFALLGGQSVLRHSVDLAAAFDDAAFADGVARGLAAPERLTRALFGVRAAALLQGLGAAAATARLSGLLVGTEIASAGIASAGIASAGIAGAGLLAGGVTLVASGALAERYGRALEVAGVAASLIDAEAATRAGLMHAAGRLWPDRMEHAA